MERFSLKSFRERDHVGRWYEIAKSLGRNDMNIFGRGLWDPKTRQLKSIERRDFSHAVMDGAGAMVTSMRELGDSSVDFPRSDRNRPPALADRPKIFLNSLKLMNKAKARWKTFQIPQDSTTRTPEDFYVLAFDPTETALIQRHCQAQGYSSNAWLIHLLQNVGAELLDDPDSEQAWLVPVNMRGGVHKPNPAANHSSAVPLFVSRNDSPALVHQQLKQRLKAQVQWGNWWAYNMSALLGDKRMKKIFTKSSSKNFWMGTVSDMGSWRSGPSYQSLGENEIWFATPPGSQNYPIGCVQFTFNGRLSMTLRVHPSITLKKNPSQLMGLKLETLIRNSIKLSTLKVDVDSSPIL